MARKKRSFYIETLGCPKNLVDSEVIVSNLCDAGLEITHDPEKAEILIVNTCGFIEPAKEESIDVILDFARLKNKGMGQKLIVTGCLVQRYKEDLQKSLSEVDYFFDLDNISGITRTLSSYKQFEDKRFILTPKHYAYLRISDGCENFCSYCAIPYIRGPVRSKSIEDIIDEAQQLVDQGVKEIIVIAQDIGNYGIDIYGESRLVELLQRLDNIQNLHWLRLLYVNPQHVTEELLVTIRNSKHILKYIDIPIQHISDNILHSMNRKTSKEDILLALSLIRTIVPNISIRTTLIVGFPGETDQDFQELLDLVKKEQFDHLGAFTYFQEDGTQAALLPNQVPENVKQKRYDRIMETQKSISQEKLQGFIGNKLTVIVDKKIKPKIYECRSQFDAPDIDGIIYLEKAEVEVGDLVEVEIVDSLEYDLIALPVKKYRSNT
ncbi:MAG: 30S ribosomal protein S12 methylthiotransferase RimO [Candidatus Cloacimonetes bacterium]|nr:30S ribosomal protein S12 methylthiotransferase RimO [Candidatus Cloacimonadota bacterium]